VPASRYQSPYKMSDALAMGTAIISSPVSDLATFAEHDLMWSVPYGDIAALAQTITTVFEDPAESARRRQRGSEFFLREMSYGSVLPAFALGAATLEPNKVHPVAARFAEFFSEYTARVLRGG